MPKRYNRQKKVRTESYLPLEKRIAVISGATRGIGFEIARVFAARGATVLLCSRNIESAHEACKVIGKNTRPFSLDITSPASVSAFVHEAVNDYGSIDILVNNAGYAFDNKLWYREIHQVTEDDLDRVLEVDLKGTFRLVRNVLPVMVKSKAGVVINISSTPALAGHIEGGPYTLAKTAIIALTKHIALEYGAKGIRSYSLALGNISTEATFGSMNEKARKLAEEENAMKRWGRPEEVAKIAACIASDDFSFATGNTIVIDGGLVLH